MTSLTSSPYRKKVAIVGSGVAGIGALWALNRTHHDVHIYEAEDRLGGHTNSVQWVNGKNKTMVDTGFIVLNTATYPNFIAFLKSLKIPTTPTEMTFGVSRDYGLFEWAGTSLSAVFAEKQNLWNPNMWRMIFDIIRFNQFALDLLINDNGASNSATEVSRSSQAPEKELSIGDYLEAEGYSDAFKNDYLIPMTAAVWSTSPDKCTLDFPAVTLVRFLWNHHLLSTVSARPEWLTIPSCSKSYIDAVMRGFPSNHLHLNRSVASLENTSSNKVLLTFESGEQELFDHVILATHGDDALKIISRSATLKEKSILNNFKTSPNTAILHSDLSLMPKRRVAWSSWNYMTLSSSLNGKSNSSPSQRSGDIDQVCLTYNMNILQHIPTETFGNVLVTLNPLHLPPASNIQGTYKYKHPLYTAAAVKAQAMLPQIQNTRGISYAGAWTKYGFHEDAFSSGIKAAIEHLGADIPFQFVDSTFSRGRAPKLGILDLILRLWIQAVQVLVVILEGLWGVGRGNNSQMQGNRGGHSTLNLVNGDGSHEKND